MSTPERPDVNDRHANGTILGVNTRYYPSPDEPIQVSVVLVAGAIGDYAAYAGSGPLDWIKDYGDKLSFLEACIHFPSGLVEERYRP